MFQFVEDLKSDRSFFFYSGSTALYALLKSMGIQQGDEVILPAFTCPAVPSVVARRGARPVYADIDTTTFNLAPDKLEAKVTPRTKAVIVQHTYGIPAEMEPILELVRRHALWIIEDACHAFGSKYRGQEVGTFGDAAFYSFGWYKPITLGAGGAAVVNNSALRPRIDGIYRDFVAPALKELVVLNFQYAAYTCLFSPSWFWFMKEIYRRLRDFGSGPRKGKLGPLILGHHYGNYLDAQVQNTLPGDTHSAGTESPNVSGRAFTPVQQSGEIEGKKMAPLQEKRLFRKLDLWHNMAANQKRIVSRYQELLSQAGIAPAKLDSHLEPVYYKYPLLFDRKREIFEQAQKAQIEMSDMFGSPLYPPERRANWKALGYEEGMCPVTEHVADRIVALPVHDRVRAQQIERTVILLASFKSRK